MVILVAFWLMPAIAFATATIPFYTSTKPCLFFVFFFEKLFRSIFVFCFYRFLSFYSFLFWWIWWNLNISLSSTLDFRFSFIRSMEHGSSYACYHHICENILSPNLYILGDQNLLYSEVFAYFSQWNETTENKGTHSVTFLFSFKDQTKMYTFENIVLTLLRFTYTLHC